MKDIGQAAGVSATTVSHVLNNTRPVKEETAARVRQAARELGYRPNSLARSLRRNESLTIGLIVPDIANPFFAEVSRGLEVASFQAGYTVIVGNAGGDPDHLRRYLNVLASKRVDGMVIAPGTMRPEVMGDLVDSDIPLVLVDNDAPGLDSDRVVADYPSGGRQVVDLLISLGHQRIACVAAPAVSRSTSPTRLHGYRAAMQEAGLDDPALCLLIDDLPGTPPTTEFEAGYRATAQLLTAEARPTAVFLTNDLMAIGALRAAADAGLSVPDDLSIVGFDDVEPSRFASPSLTTVAQPRLAMGQLAAELIIDRIQHRHREPARQVLDVSLVVRQSTGRVSAH
jgi:LacI family transcriptional regulator